MVEAVGLKGCIKGKLVKASGKIELDETMPLQFTKQEPLPYQNKTKASTQKYKNSCSE